jgi:hypothetical protein
MWLAIVIMMTIALLIKLLFQGHERTQTAVLNCLAVLLLC